MKLTKMFQKLYLQKGLQFILITFISCILSCHSKQEINKQVFAYNESTGIATLDPAFAKNQSVIWAVHQLYNTLVELDSNLEIKPSVAKSWNISNDGLIYTFHLRNDVYFQDNPAFINGKGRRCTAHDVVFSLNRIIDKNTASSGAWIFNGHVVNDSPFTALNDTTFQLKLQHPFHPILEILTMQYCSIVPKEVVMKEGKNFGRMPCGTGPFQLFFWEEGVALVLHKNKHYWEKDNNGTSLPYLDAIKISFYQNKATEFLQFRQGELSFINDIDPVFKDEVLTKYGSLQKAWIGKMQLQKHPYLNTEYLGILMDTTLAIVKQSPLQYKKIRQAINYAINKEQMMLYLRNSIGYAANAGFCPMGLPSNNTAYVKGYSYNPNKARQLLLESGITSQNMAPIHLLTIPTYANLASFVAKQCEDVGVPVQVEVVQKSVLLEQTAQSKALFFRGSWMADYPDAENYMAVFYSKNPAPPNYTRYRNTTFDNLYTQALATDNDSIRYALYRQMDQLVMDDAPVVPLFYDMVIHFVQNNVQGFEPNALNLLELRHTKIISVNKQ